jgi:AraC-like DNA-binding protein
LAVRPLNPKPAKPTELSWLSEVSESRQPVSAVSPVWVRHGAVWDGPPVPHPERHPYCEFGIHFEGINDVLVEDERAERVPGDVLLLGPGVPHWAEIKKYPMRFISVHFLPSVLIDAAPETDGPMILRRFTAKQTLAHRLIRPPEQLRRRFASSLRAMASEFEANEFGREALLRTLLIEPLVYLLRWERRTGRELRQTEKVEWDPIIRALQYLRHHYAEPVYAQDLCRAVRVSESHLKALFRDALGMSWVKYLQGYRIHRAVTFLEQPGGNVTETALAVGFESQSHFIHAFRACFGVSPKTFQLGKGDAGLQRS